jgi:dTDP-4-amino-4,6-dideoxygalactose transaminase
MNSRLDEIQAGLLLIKLRNLNKYNAFRQRVAQMYLESIRNPILTLPKIGEGRTHVWHIFAVLTKRRDDLQAYLKDKGIGSLCHYPCAIHAQPAYKDLIHGSLPIAEKIAAEQLSLPLYYGMSDEQVMYVIDVINQFE